MPPICSLSISLTKSDRQCGSLRELTFPARCFLLQTAFPLPLQTRFRALPLWICLSVLLGLSLIRLMVYFKGKNAKKYRKGIEYGSARWGNAEDIKPYTDPVFQNNVLLTQTERLTMNSRPKQPKYARNKNILVIGGSGSGKTRFFVKPNLMQMHSSYVVTDPKGTVLVECGKLFTARRVSDKGTEHDKL